MNLPIDPANPQAIASAILGNLRVTITPSVNESLNGSVNASVAQVANASSSFDSSGIIAYSVAGFVLFLIVVYLVLGGRKDFDVRS